MRAAAGAAAFDDGNCYPLDNIFRGEIGMTTTFARKLVLGAGIAFAAGG